MYPVTKDIMMAVPTFVYNNVAKEEVPRISEQFNSFGAVIVKGLIARATIESFCSALVKTIAARLASIGQRVGLEMELDDSYTIVFVQSTPNMGVKSLLLPVICQIFTG